MKSIFRLGISGILIALFFSSLMSCEKDVKNSGSASNASFLIGSKGDGDIQRGLYKFRIGSEPEFITSHFPNNYSSYYADENNGVVAFVVPSHMKNGTSGVAYFTLDEPDNIAFAPIPSASEGFYYSIHTVCPHVLNDGRIAYLVSLETDSPYDSWFAGMVAIYNPQNGDIELSGDPTEFVLAQPEQGSDTEDGTMKTGFTISPDDQYAFCEVYGYGTDGGIVHRDYSFIVKYKIGSPGSYTRLTQMEALPAAVTGDGKYLLLAGSFGLRKYDLQNNTIHDVGDYYLAPTSGQISRISSKVLRSWGSSNNYGAGFGELNLGLRPEEFIHILDERELKSPKNYYPKFDLGVQYAKDESKVYFGVYRSSQQDKYINISSSPIVELNEEPDSLDNISSDFDMNVFMLIGE